MDAQTATNVLRWYEELEEQLVYFMKDIPPQGKNLDVWSPALATVIVESCNLIESVFYHITPDPTTYGSTKKREKLFLCDYAAFYSNRHSLSERKVVIFQEPLDWCTPFEKWAGATTFDNPEWWDIHNKSKHSRLDHFEKFTLKRAIEALAGALVVIATAPMVSSARALATVMVKHGWLNLDLEMGIDREFLDHFYNRNVAKAWLAPETPLFAAILSVVPLPQTMSSDLKWILFNPEKLWPIGKSQKLKKWLQLS
jgi:hypothetical protein